MTPTHPSPEAMEVAHSAHLDAAYQKISGNCLKDGKRECPVCVAYALHIDAFARARVEEENRACEAEARDMHTLGDVIAAISARRGRG